MARSRHRPKPAPMAARSHRVNPQVLIEELHLHQEELRAQNAQLREAQDQLERSRDRYANLYDLAPVAYVSLDHSGIIEDLNQRGVALLGLRRGQLIGAPLLGRVVEGEKQTFLDHLYRCRLTDERQAVETVLRTPEREIPVRVLTRREQDPSGDVTFRMSIIDLSEPRRLEAERREAEAERARIPAAERAARESSAAKDRFLASLSHELRTPLTPVLAAAQALAGADGLPAEARSLADVIRRNVRLEARLIDDLLDLTRIVENKLTLQLGVVDVHAVLGNALTMCADALRTKGIDWTLEVSAPRHHANADADRLCQVFCNLITSAGKFTPPGGLLTFRSRTRQDGRVEVSITDTGPGMTPDRIASLFRPFTQGTAAAAAPHSGGLGLGLAICRGIMDAHGGRIDAFSAGPGTGSTFVVALDTVAAPAIDAPQAPAAAPLTAGAPARPLRILVAEDHRDSADMLAVLLTAQGHEVRIAQSAAEALAQIPGCELLISDLGLPDRSGLDLVREAQAIKNLPAIALSGYGAAVDKQRCAEAGFDAHLTKPVDLEKLLDTIARVVEHRAG